MDRINKLKSFLKENYQGMQAFDSKNIVGDYMITVYDDDNITVDYAPEYEYIEIFGLTDEEYNSIAGNGHVKV